MEPLVTQLAEQFEGNGKVDLSRLEQAINLMSERLEESSAKDRTINQLVAERAQAQEKALHRLILAPLLENLAMLHDSIERHIALLHKVDHDHQNALTAVSRQVIAWSHKQLLKIREELMEVFSREGVKPSAGPGVKVNPRLHVVRGTVAANNEGEHHVISEVQRQGFVGEDEWVIRKADVTVKVFSHFTERSQP